MVVGDECLQINVNTTSVVDVPMNLVKPIYVELLKVISRNKGTRVAVVAVMFVELPDTPSLCHEYHDNDPSIEDQEPFQEVPKSSQMRSQPPSLPSHASPRWCRNSVENKQRDPTKTKQEDEVVVSKHHGLEYDIYINVATAAKDEINKGMRKNAFSDCWIAEDYLNAEEQCASVKKFQLFPIIDHALHLFLVCTHWNNILPNILLYERIWNPACHSQFRTRSLQHPILAVREKGTGLVVLVFQPIRIHWVHKPPRRLGGAP
mmetsp:Transcript_90534/g.142993  ORF Transcript_90534/g.142993 Transcript_90534/m.142993 type:complete len:262 (+) Transcript_90534:1386-2171(+)